MNEKGLTLISFLLYLAIASGFLATSGWITLEMTTIKERISVMEEVNQNARFVMEKIALTIRNAQGINLPAAGSSNASTSLAMLDAAKNPALFDLQNGAVRTKEGSGPYVNLTSDEITVTNLNFTNTSYVGTPGTIRVEMHIQYNNVAGRGEYEFAQSFYTTANIRRR